MKFVTNPSPARRASFFRSLPARAARSMVSMGRGRFSLPLREKASTSSTRRESRSASDTMMERYSLRRPSSFCLPDRSISAKRRMDVRGFQFVRYTLATKVVFWAARRISDDTIRSTAAAPATMTASRALVSDHTATEARRALEAARPGSESQAPASHRGRRGEISRARRAASSQPRGGGFARGSPRSSSTASGRRR